MSGCLKLKCQRLRADLPTGVLVFEVAANQLLVRLHCLVVKSLGQSLLSLCLAFFSLGLPAGLCSRVSVVVDV